MKNFFEKIHSLRDSWRGSACGPSKLLSGLGRDHLQAPARQLPAAAAANGPALVDTLPYIKEIIQV